MSSYPLHKTPGDTSWFVADRFGMFIHWGLYALPARHEWIKTREFMTDDWYQRYFDRFDPDLYDPREWARTAKAAGMKYAVITTKHHDGFCLFDSQYTDYKVTNTPCGRDVIKEYVEAFRAEGLKVGFYYSLLDWHHPEFPYDCYHPRRNDADAWEQSKDRDMTVYAQYMRDQVRELMTNYGKINLLWMDFSYPGRDGEGDKAWQKGKGAKDWEADKLIQLVRELQPGIMINNRTGLEQDLWTPEQIQPTVWEKHPDSGDYLPWELCHTFSGSWGYYRDETSWKSPEVLIRMLINTVSLGGNLLMNVGPTGRGLFDDRATKALKAYEDWMRLNSRAIYNCTMAEPGFKAPADCRLTQSQDGKRLYVHLYAYPSQHLMLPGFGGKVAYAQFLHDASELAMTEGHVSHFAEEGHQADEELLVLYLPALKPDVVVPVIELYLKD